MMGIRPAAPRVSVGIKVKPHRPTQALIERSEFFEMSRAALAVKLNEERANPFLSFEDRRPGLHDGAAIQDQIARTRTLSEVLEAQLGELILSSRERELARFFVYNLDERGYLDLCGRRLPDGSTGPDLTIPDLAKGAGITVAAARRVLGLVQRLDPPGAGARDLRECLYAQAQVLGLGELAIQIIVDHLPDVERDDLPAIARALGVDLADVTTAVGKLRQLDPEPGRAYGPAAEAALPDLFVARVGDSFAVSHKDDGAPRVTLRGLPPGSGASPRQRVQYERARQMVTFFEERRRRLVQLMEHIVDSQHEVFARGPEHGRPLGMREIAARMRLDESTISRLTSNKFVATSFGVVELKTFFKPGVPCADGQAITPERVKMRIRRLVDAEDKTSPLSDPQLHARLQAELGVLLTRRAITKYRRAAGIGAASERRRRIGVNA